VQLLRRSRKNAHGLRDVPTVQLGADSDESQRHVCGLASPLRDGDPAWSPPRTCAGAQRRGRRRIGTSTWTTDLDASLAKLARVLKSIGEMDMTFVGRRGLATKTVDSRRGDGAIRRRIQLARAQRDRVLSHEPRHRGRPLGLVDSNRGPVRRHSARETGRMRACGSSRYRLVGDGQGDRVPRAVCATPREF
jgi:hypothetical protein